MTEGKALAREQKIGKYYVDGYDEEAEIIYEFYGDYWHGNPATTRRTFVNPHLKQTMENLHAATVQREIALEQMGYSVIKIWESEYDQKLAEDEDFRETLKDIHVHAPLQPRDALYGGRTNGTRLHYKCEPENKYVFGGRLGMREDRLSTQFISEPKDFYELLLNDALEIHNIEFFSDTVIQVAYKSKEDFIPVNPKTNVILAAFTTAHARLHLYNYMAQVGRNLIYFDTDSLMWIHRQGDPEVPLGNYMGDLTNELNDGEFITEVTICAPKSYAYVTNKGKHVCKTTVNADTFNRTIKKTLNLNTFTSLWTTPGPQVYPLRYSSVIRRNKRTLEIDAVDQISNNMASQQSNEISSTIPEDSDLPEEIRRLNLDADTIAFFASQRSAGKFAIGIFCL
ncbi:uncharacterized protein LOC129582370 [Paramacrobiotus metropolitanus]|uniref:uncharacterized protein LOC129582370 n=1 Tax=Paramacrobiotus metropolitanus TaxID=2943436 RepID=UPI0024456112|nr:uncharacterized protein LOC129582370 [Paramacrobiotus metropolitanus]